MQWQQETNPFVAHAGTINNGEGLQFRCNWLFFLVKFSSADDLISHTTYTCKFHSSKQHKKVAAINYAFFCSTLLYTHTITDGFHTKLFKRDTEKYARKAQVRTLS